jgi:hypothetical protein
MTMIARVTIILLLFVALSMLGALLLILLNNDRVETGGPPAIWHASKSLTIEYSISHHSTPGKDTVKIVKILNYGNEIFKFEFRQSTGGWHSVDAYYNDVDTIYIVNKKDNEIGASININSMDAIEYRNTKLHLVGLTKLIRHE